MSSSTTTPTTWPGASLQARRAACKLAGLRPGARHDQGPATAEVDFETTRAWHTGYNAQIAITNTGDTSIRGWRLDFALEAPINSLWDGQLDGEAPHLHRRRR